MHGRYSKVNVDRLKDLIAEMKKDENPLDLSHELALQRALLVDLLNRFEESQEALLGWYESFRLQQPIPKEYAKRFESLVDEFEARGIETDHQDELVRCARDYLRKSADLEMKERPRQVLDISDAIKQLDMVGKMVDRMHKIQMTDSISKGLFNQLIQNIFQVINANVKDPETLRRIQEGCSAIPVGGRFR